MITIDPGKTYFAYARWDCNGQLIEAAKLGRNSIHVLPVGEPAIIEKQWGQAKNTPLRDLLDLAVSTGEYGGHFFSRRYVLPSSCPKPIRHKQALARLRPSELAVLPKNKTDLKHVLCAVWIGLNELGRLVAVA